jgi:hypothetical protein
MRNKKRGVVVVVQILFKESKDTRALYYDGSSSCLRDLVAPDGKNETNAKTFPLPDSAPWRLCG